MKRLNRYPANDLRKGSILEFPMSTTRRLTLRLPEDLAVRLDALSAATGRPLNTCVTAACEEWADAQMTNEDLALCTLQIRALRESLASLASPKEG